MHNIKKSGAYEFVKYMVEGFYRENLRVAVFRKIRGYVYYVLSKYVTTQSRTAKSFGISRSAVSLCIKVFKKRLNPMREKDINELYLKYLKGIVINV